MNVPAHLDFVCDRCGGTAVVVHAHPTGDEAEFLCVLCAQIGDYAARALHAQDEAERAVCGAVVMVLADELLQQPGAPRRLLDRVLADQEARP